MASNKKPSRGKLHTFVATGGKPKDFGRNPALNSKTVTGLKDKKSK
jgi:hypothetical protein